jgi:nitroimidazol reductase NimA-like FMN-containing flavoprotein (pyridoxamine 5'-phosphate oxidase superfamily)
MDLGTEYSGVVIFGRLRIVDVLEEARQGLQLLCDKYFPHLEPGVDYETAAASDLKGTAVLRIDISSWSGKESRAPDDFPGAFFFKDLSK